MIQNNDRSGYFGASDTRYVMNDNHNTKTWQEWWSVKVGERENSFTGNIWTRAGNLFEHSILEAVDPEVTMDGQIIHERYLLRVNYDGYNNGMIYEVKTHKANKLYSVPEDHWQQVQVEMFCYQEMHQRWFLPPFQGLIIASYALNPDEYYLQPNEVVVDPERIQYHPVKYNKAFIRGEYLPRLKVLARALRKGKFPG